MSEDSDQGNPLLLLCLIEPAAERRPESEDVEVGRRRIFDNPITDGAVVEVTDGLGTLAAIVPAKISVLFAISMYAAYEVTTIGRPARSF